MVLAAHSAHLPNLTGLMAESVLEPFPCTGWYLCSINFCFCLKMDYILQQEHVSSILCAVRDASSCLEARWLHGTSNASNHCGESLSGVQSKPLRLHNFPVPLIDDIWCLQQCSSLLYLYTLESFLGPFPYNITHMFLSKTVLSWPSYIQVLALRFFGINVPYSTMQAGN